MRTHQRTEHCQNARTTNAITNTQQMSCEIFCRKSAVKNIYFERIATQSNKNVKHHLIWWTVAHLLLCICVFPLCNLTIQENDSHERRTGSVIGKIKWATKLMFVHICVCVCVCVPFPVGTQSVFCIEKSAIWNMIFYNHKYSSVQLVRVNYGWREMNAREEKNEEKREIKTKGKSHASKKPKYLGMRKALLYLFLSAFLAYFPFLFFLYFWIFCIERGILYAIDWSECTRTQKRLKNQFNHTFSSVKHTVMLQRPKYD